MSTGVGVNFYSLIQLKKMGNRHFKHFKPFKSILSAVHSIDKLNAPALRQLSKQFGESWCSTFELIAFLGYYLIDN